VTDEAKQPGIRLVQAFLEKASFGHRGDFLDRDPKSDPGITDMAISLESGVSDDGAGALVRARVRTKPTTRGAYVFDVTMAALLERSEPANMPLEEYVEMAGWTLLFPFVRETIANLTTRGRFGPVWLNPFNLKAARGKRRAKNK
jgi:preprotein translocase subunit SecB